MAWLETHTALINHPKTLALAENMSWNKFEAVGRLHAFWAWVMDYAPMGDLRRFSANVIAGSVGLTGEDGERFVQSLVKTGWIDEGEGVFRVHDWPEYAGRYLRNWKFKRRPDLYAQMLAVYGLADTPPADTPPEAQPASATSLRQSVDVSKTNGRQLADVSTKSLPIVEQPTNQPNQPTNQEKISLRGRSPARVSAQTTQELRCKEFILRPDESEFKLFCREVNALVLAENKERRANPFAWKAQTGSFESDMRSLCYKLSDTEKLHLLTDALNILHQRWNWTGYVLVGIKATIRATLTAPVSNHYGFTMYKLKHPHELISAVADGNLQKPVSELLNKMAGTR